MTARRSLIGVCQAWLKSNLNKKFNNKNIRNITRQPFLEITPSAFCRQQLFADLIVLKKVQIGLSADF
jgi:hypothetical protein